MLFYLIAAVIANGIYSLVDYQAEGDQDLNAICITFSVRSCPLGGVNAPLIDAAYP
jgi:hypothetical protein